MVLTKEKVHQELFKNDFELFKFFCLNCETSITTSSAKSFVQLLGNSPFQPVYQLISSKIAASPLTESNDNTNVLRDNSIPVLILLSLLQLPEAEKFINSVTKDCFGRISELLGSLEVDPNYLPEGYDIEKNYQNIVECTDLISKSLERHVGSLPVWIKSFCYLLKRDSYNRLIASGIEEQVAAEGALRLVACWIILRFVSPALVFKNDLSNKTVSKEEKKGTIILVKVFNQLGSQAEFGSREETMRPLNAKLTAQKESLREFLKSISEEEIPFPKCVPVYNEEAFDAVFKFMATNLPKIEKKQETFDKGGKNKLKRLQDLLVLPEESGTDPKKTSTDKNSPKAMNNYGWRFPQDFIFPISVAVFAVTVIAVGVFLKN